MMPLVRCRHLRSEVGTCFTILGAFARPRREMPRFIITFAAVWAAAVCGNGVTAYSPSFQSNFVLNPSRRSDPPALHPSLAWLPAGAPPPPHRPDVAVADAPSGGSQCVTADPCNSDSPVLPACGHGHTLFTEGLAVHATPRGPWTLVESVGQWAASAVLFRDLQPDSLACSDPPHTIPLPTRTFAEGVTVAFDHVFLLSYTDCVVRVYPVKPTSSQPTAQFPLLHTPASGECWGLAFLPALEAFVVSDGSDTLYVYDRRLQHPPTPVFVAGAMNGRGDGVRSGPPTHGFDGHTPGPPTPHGTPGLRLNELEVVDGEVMAVVDGTEFIARVAVDVPRKSGRVLSWLRVAGGLGGPSNAGSFPEPDCDVAKQLAKETSVGGDMNGLALLPPDATGQRRLLVTGKRWASMYVLPLPDFNAQLADDELEDACWARLQGHLEHSFSAVMNVVSALGVTA